MKLEKGHTVVIPRAAVVVKTGSLSPRQPGTQGLDKLTGTLQHSELMRN